MKVKLKVCGMKDPGNIDRLNKLKPDFMGMIFYEKSPRCVPADLAIVPQKEVELVGVFVNASVEEIMQKASAFHFNVVQLHGEESVEMVSELKARGMKVIKVFSVDDQLPIEQMRPFTAKTDYFLFDTKTPLYGGSGSKFNWDILADYPLTTPYFLSGGIDLEDVPGILDRQFPGLFAIDVNSRFETAPGIKDMEKVKALKALI